MSAPPLPRCTGGRQGLLVVIPFVLLFAAKETDLQTRVWADGAARRDLQVVSDQYAQSAVRGAVNAIEGPWDWGRDSTATDVAFRRSAMPGTAGEIPGVSLKITQQFGWPTLLRTRYEYRDIVALREFDAKDPKQAAAAQEMRLKYAVTLPGTVDENAVSPGGQPDGSRVTWNLTADKVAAQQGFEVSAASTRPRWDFFVFVLYVIIAYSACALKPLLRRVCRSKPRTI